MTVLAAGDSDVVLLLHKNLAVSVLAYTLIVGLWGLLLYLRGSAPTGSYLAALILNEALVALQGLVGVALLGQGHRPHDALHYLYGIVLLLTLPAVYFSPYVARGTERRDTLFLGLAGIFMVGLAIRAFATGGG
jgi:hypothetical protein